MAQVLLGKVDIKGLIDYFRGSVEYFGYKETKYWEPTITYHRVLSTEWNEEHRCFVINTVAFSLTLVHKSKWMGFGNPDRKWTEQAFVINNREFRWWDTDNKKETFGNNREAIRKFFEEIIVLDEKEYVEKYEEFRKALDFHFSTFIPKLPDYKKDVVTPQEKKLPKEEPKKLGFFERILSND